MAPPTPTHHEPSCDASRTGKLTPGSKHQDHHAAHDVQVLPKIGTPTEARLLELLHQAGDQVGNLLSPQGTSTIYYTRKLRYHSPFFTTPPKTHWPDGRVTDPTELKELRLPDSDTEGLFRSADDVRPARLIECNSFPSGTPVLMADGSHKAINEIDPGDQVLAYDEETGEWTARSVLDQWSHLDTGEMVTVTLTDGSSVSATDHHLFWEQGAQEWVPAEELETGDVLVDPDGPVEVADVSYWPDGPNIVWELAVDIDHTFTVHTGTADVVVHNQVPCDFPQDVVIPPVRRQHVLDGNGTGGFHHRANGVDPANSRLLSVDIEFDSGSLAGVYYGKVEICTNGRCQIKPSTFFPDSWTKSRVLDEINSAYQIALASGKVVADRPFVERSASGMPIEIVVDAAGQLKTAYPAIF